MGNEKRKKNQSVFSSRHDLMSSRNTMTYWLVFNRYWDKRKDSTVFALSYEYIKYKYTFAVRFHWQFSITLTTTISSFVTCKQIFFISNIIPSRSRKIYNRESDIKIPKLRLYSSSDLESFQGSMLFCAESADGKTEKSLFRNCNSIQFGSSVRLTSAHHPKNKEQYREPAVIEYQLIFGFHP